MANITIPTLFIVSDVAANEVECYTESMVCRSNGHKAQQGYKKKKKKGDRE